MHLLWSLILLVSFPMVATHVAQYEISFSRQGNSFLILLWVVIVLVIEKNIPKFRTIILTLSWSSFVIVLLLSLFFAWHWCVIMGCMGGLLNTTAMLVNQNKMPVLNPHSEPDFTKKGIFPFGHTDWSNTSMDMDFRHKLVDSDTKLFCLCDWIVISNHSIVSVGDVLIYFSSFISLVHMILIFITLS